MGIATRIGRRFGKLVVEEALGEMVYRCKCDCGGIRDTHWQNLKRGSTKSCGCLQKQSMGEPRSHSRVGVKAHPLYETWRTMLRRCLLVTHHKYYMYGAKGITVCAEWQRDFWAFADYMGVKPSPYHSIDRIDGKGNYAPGNVRWATPKEQSDNTDRIPVRDTSRMQYAVLLNGVKVSSAEAAKQLGIGHESAQKARRKGYLPHEAIALAVLNNRAVKKQQSGVRIDWAKIAEKVPAACKLLGLEEYK